MRGVKRVHRVIRPEGKGNQEDMEKEEVSRNTLGSIIQFWLAPPYGHYTKYTHNQSLAVCLFVFLSACLCLSVSLSSIQVVVLSKLVRIFVQNWEIGRREEKNFNWDIIDIWHCVSLKYTWLRLCSQALTAPTYGSLCIRIEIELR